MKNLIMLALCVLLSGCTIIYHNEKIVTAQGSNIKTTFGKLKNATVKFRSTMDVYIPWKMKGENEKNM